MYAICMLHNLEIENFSITACQIKKKLYYFIFSTCQLIHDFYQTSKIFTNDLFLDNCTRHCKKRARIILRHAHHKFTISEIMYTKVILWHRQREKNRKIFNLPILNRFHC